MELREKIVRLIDDAERHTYSRYLDRFVQVGSSVVLPWKAELADAILELPEIKEALSYSRALTTGEGLTITSMPPIYTGETPKSSDDRS